jgi:hypothetical protein
MAKTKVYREYAENYQEFQEPISDAEVADLFLSPRFDDEEFEHRTYVMQGQRIIPRAATLLYPNSKHANR